MGIYRGAGGTGDAVNDAASEASLTSQLVAQAQQSEANAAASAAAAQTAENNAETAEVNAETAETNAASSAASALSSKNAAATSATNAASSASAASTSATNAASSASAASTSASSASTSASTATTQATNASNSASAAATSATNASNSASAAATSATNAASSASAAATSETNAAASATAAAGYVVPSQTGNAGKYLKTDGTAVAWDALDISTVDISGTLPVANGGTGATTAASARTNLGVTATGADTTYAYRANNLSDLASASTARTNLGLGTIATQAASSVAITGGAIDGTTVGATTASSGRFTSLSDSGNLTFTGTGNYILGDFSSTTSVGFQTSTANSTTRLKVYPSGTGTVSAAYLYNNSDPTNSGFGALIYSTSAFNINSGINGTGTYYPIVMTTGGSERLRIDTSGNVGIGTSSPTATLNVYSASTSVIQLDGDSGTAIRATRYSTDASAAALQTRKTRGTFASPTAVASGDNIGNLQLQGYGGSNYRNIVTISGFVDTYTSDTNISGYLTFNTNSGGAGVTERLRITAAGDVGIGTSSPTAKLTVDATNAGYTNGIDISNTTSFGYGSSINFKNIPASGGSLTTVAQIQQYYQASNKYGLTFSKYDSGLGEAMRIDSSGNVGIGNTGFASRFYVKGGSSTQTVSQKVAFDTQTTTMDVWERSDGAVSCKLVYDGSGLINFGTSTAHPLTFLTSNTERMRIDSSGNLLVAITATQNISGVNTDHTFAGTTSTNRWVCGFINSSASSPYGLAVSYTGSAPNATGNQFLFCRDTGGTRFEVRSNGGIANYSANNVNLSDEREKTNIQLAGSYLDKICAIPVKTFNYIDQNIEEDDGLTLGVVAQDVQSVAPELVMESDWANKGEPEKMRLSIYQTDLQYALMKAIQEQQVMIEELKAKVAALEAA